MGRRILRRQQASESLSNFMDTKLIGTLDEAPATFDDGFLVKAVLFGSGEMRRLQRSTHVYGLVLANYQGLRFGDDGTFTALVASELPLSAPGLDRVESIVNEAVRRVNPTYCAEFVGYIALDDAAVHLDVEMKQSLGVNYPRETSWSNGRLHTI